MTKQRRLAACWRMWSAMGAVHVPVIRGEDDDRPVREFRRVEFVEYRGDIAVAGSPWNSTCADAAAPS